MTGEPAADIDADVARLHRDLDEARQQLSATSEVLTALGRSASDLELVLGTVVESARRLCKADVAQLHLVEGNAYRLASFSGLSDDDDYLVLLNRNPVRFDRRSLVGRVGEDRCAQQITDVLADPEYGRHELQRLGGFRTIVGVPMLLDQKLVGVLSVWRTEVDPFGDRDTEVLTTFAAQAAIAIQQVDLVRALEARQGELRRKVEQLEALGHVGDAVSSSLDLDHVLATIVEHAVELSDTDGGSIFDFDEAAEEFRIRTTFGTNAELVDALRKTHIGIHETLVGRVALMRQPQQVVDLDDCVDLDPHLRCLKEAGWRSLLAVPIHREERIIGALVVRRRTPGGFSEEIADLLETFASQSALAILNARLFKELERKGAELEVASRHKSEFLASMSHELRTPLNAVIGFSEVLLERMSGDALSARQEDYVRDIWESGRHLLALLNDILDLSKVEAGRMELDYSTFSVHDALEAGISLVRERAAEHGIELDVQIGSDASVVEADELRFKQVLLNLLSNAVKFTGDDGRVEVRATVDGEMLTVAVADNGLGVGPEDRERIFGSFEQGTRGPPRTEGTGLGLALSKRIVELHGGKIWLESEVNVGSTFGFTIPLRSDRTLEDRGADTPDPTASSPTVVIVEDDRRSLELLGLYLEGTGVDVVAARDGQEGLEVVRRLHPAAVVLDLYLPKLDGWDVLALLKADPGTSAIPVIIVSMVDERGKGFALGAADYLVKPVGRDEVLAALNRALALPESQPSVVAIDDDPKALALVTAVLEREGWTVLQAVSGEDGVALARSRHPSVVLVDLVMPGMDGFDVVARLRRDPETASIPIVILTAKALTREDKERLRGQISYVANKGEFDSGHMADLVRRATGSLAPPIAEAP